MPREQINVTLLPTPRKSRHPYQWGCMISLLAYAVLNLRVGLAANSPLGINGGHPEYLSWTMLMGATACLAAMVVPDNYWRMFIEFIGHSLLVFTMGAYGVVSYAAHTHTAAAGVSLNLIFAMGIGVAAVVRCVQVAHTIYRVWFSPVIVR